MNISTDNNPVNTSLVERKVEHNKLTDIPDISHEQIDEILLANDVTIARQNGIKKGELLMLPLKLTKYDKEHKITITGIHRAYEKPYAEQNISLDNSNSEAGQEEIPANYHLNKKQLSMINENKNLNTGQKTFVKTLLPIIMSRVKSGDKFNGAGLMYMAIHETGWDTSVIALKGHNPFGVKAGGGWNGPTIDAKGREQKPNGELTKPQNMLWRSYKTWGEAIDDFAKFIGDGARPWFGDELYCDQTAKQTVTALEYKVDKKTCSKVGDQPFPGALEYAHATDHNYVKEVLSIRDVINIERIIAAGEKIKIQKL